MSTIRCIYYPNADGSRRDPGFQATDQHPSAVRYPFDHATKGLLNVDAVGGAPTLAEIDAVLGLDASGQAVQQRISTDEAERQACKIDAQVLPLVNQTKAEWITWAGTNFPTLTAAEKTRLGILFWVVSVGVRRSIRNGG
jgi:hypothetical protein